MTRVEDTEEVFVEVLEDETGKVVKRMGPMHRTKAQRVADGAGINLNWSKYTVRVVTAEPKEKSR